MSTIYKNHKSKSALMGLYDSKLKSLDVEYEELDVSTFAGNTHVVVAGNKSGEPLVVLHGINAGAPLTVEAMEGLADKYRIYAIDSNGQTTKSAETRLPLNDDSLGRWLTEVLDALELTKVCCIGVSYGGFLLQKLIGYAPDRVKKIIFVVPGGFVNGPFWDSTKKLSFPLMRFLFTKKEKHLKSFMNAFYNSIDEYAVSFQTNTLLGTKMDYRRPPLFTAKDAEGIKQPVYAIVADTDVFFPGYKTLEICQQIFKNFKGKHVLQNAKHIPQPSSYQEIQDTIRKWIED